MSAKEQVEELRQRLEQYEYEYYVLNAPTVSDQEFDALMRELEALEAAHPELRTPSSPTQRVGSELLWREAERVETRPHRYPMLSLQNSYSWEETTEFYTRVQRMLGEDEVEIVAELKYDGTSISIIYEQGVLAYALTRGDGTKGEDVTEAVRAIRSVPLKLRGTELPDYIEVRGEILLPWQDFERLNREREEEGLPLFANPRNAVAGTIKTKENVGRVVSYRNPTIYCYYLMSNDQTWLPQLHHERLELMRSLGLKVSRDYKVCHKLEELKAFIDKWDGARETLDVATDGIVLKVNNYRLHERLGYTAKSPRWAVAFKYNAESATTRLESVSFQVARTGVVTPVANLQPVQLSGTTVQRATLHNGDIIEQLDLHIGDVVMVEKGGEIIPKITGVKYEDRNMFLGEKVVMPTTCPDCGTPLVKEEDMAATICPNEWGCPAQIEGKIEHFCSRKAMDINIGPRTIQLLTQHLGVKSIADLYQLTPNQLLRLPNFKERKALNLVESIQASRQVPFDRVLFALGIKLVGTTIATQLAKKHRSLTALASATTEELQAQDEMGPMIAASIVNFFAEPRNQEMITRLRAEGLNFELPEQEEATQGTALAGEVVVVSGVFSTISREELKALIQQQGGKVAGSVSGKTTLLVAGENMGPSKRAQAEALGVRIVSEEEFFQAYNIR